jgi:hypothetical protein
MVTTIAMVKKARIVKSPKFVLAAKDHKPVRGVSL